MADKHITTWSYVWDFAYDGVEDTLRRMKEETGLNAVSVATSYHSVEHLRPHGKGPLTYRSKAALYFNPQTSLYRDTSIRPQISPLVEQFNDPLKRIAETCSKLRLELVSWTVCCHNSWLGEQRPELNQVNCFGGHHPETLCPANPEVRAYLAALAEDLTTNYGVRLLELESCHYEAKRHYHHHEKVAVPFGAHEDFLLALCFCSHCGTRAQAAGIDPSAVRQRVAEAMRQVLENGEPAKETVGEFLADSPMVARYVRMRIDTVTSLLQEIRRRSRSPVSAMSWASAEASGMSIPDAAKVVESITVLAYSPKEDEVRKTIRDAAAALKPAGAGVERLRVGYHTYPPNTPDRRTLERIIRASLELGVRAFSFYNWGIMPRRSLEWMKATVDVIRRG